MKKAYLFQLVAILLMATSCRLGPGDRLLDACLDWSVRHLDQFAFEANGGSGYIYYLDQAETPTNPPIFLFGARAMIGKLDFYYTPVQYARVDSMIQAVEARKRRQLFHFANLPQP